MYSLAAPASPPIEEDSPPKPVYLIEAEGVRYYHAGATDRLPEMDAFRADVAFLPVTGGYVMDEGEANAVAEAVGATERVALFLVGDRFRRLAGFVSPTAPGES